MPEFPDLADGELPAWTHPFLIGDADDIEGVQYLLTFRPFSLLPEHIQRLYFEGKLHLFPIRVRSFIGARRITARSIFRSHGRSFCRRSSRVMPVRVASACRNRAGCIIMASTICIWAKAKDTYRRTHRWQRMHREDDSTTFACEDQIHKVLFSTQPDDVGLYGKPLARNSQIWSAHFHPVLHGPSADAAILERAMTDVARGHSLGYRFFYPPMQTGRFAVFWHRPLIAFRHGGKTRTLDTTLTGYLTAEDASGTSPPELELWPRLSTEPRNTKPLTDSERARRAALAFTDQLGVPAEQTFDAKDALTFHHTANRPFEVRYWKTIAKLAEGHYLNKNSADCSTDPATQARLPWPKRDLDQLGDYLLDYYRKLARDTGSRRSSANAVPLENRFRIPLDGGWLRQPGRPRAGAQHRLRHPRPQSQRGDHDGRPLRHGLHGRHVRLSLRQERRRAYGGRPARTTITPPRRH